MHLGQFVINVKHGTYGVIVEDEPSIGVLWHQFGRPGNLELHGRYYPSWYTTPLALIRVADTPVPREVFAWLEVEANNYRIKTGKQAPGTVYHCGDRVYFPTIGEAIVMKSPLGMAQQEAYGVRIEDPTTLEHNAGPSKLSLDYRLPARPIGHKPALKTESEERVARALAEYEAIQQMAPGVGRQIDALKWLEDHGEFLIGHASATIYQLQKS